MEITTSLNSTEAAVSYDKNLHTKTMISSNSTEAAVSQDENLHSQTIKSSKFIQAGITQDENFQEENIASPQSIHSEKILKEALQKIDAKVEALVADFQEFKTTNLGHDLSLNQSFLVQNLIKENNQLKADNKKSMERINTLTLVASDLNTTIKSLENEKLSLMTAIKLIQVDYSHDVSNINREGNNEESWKEASNKRRIVKQNKESIVNTNRYSILTVEDDDNVSESNQDQQSTRPQHCPSKSYSGPESNLDQQTLRPQDHQNESYSAPEFNHGQRPLRPQHHPYASRDGPESNQDQRSTSHQHHLSESHTGPESNYDQRPTRSLHQPSEFHVDLESNYGQRPARPQYHPCLAIIGDSMLKMISPHTLKRKLNQNVRVKTFPGARLDDMEHYVQPTIKSSPDYIILHAGTNDIKNSSPKTIVDKICQIGKQIIESLPKTKLAISQIITRTDEPNLAAKVSEVNNRITGACKFMNWETISHDNIKSNHLNSYGIHLTRQGTAILAKNFINYIAH